MTKAQLIADCIVSGAAIAGLAVLIHVLRRSARGDAISRRFLFALAVLVALLGARTLAWITEGGFFLFAMYLTAGLLPLGIIVLVEGLLRRHAPLAVKYALIVGTALFTVLAFLDEARVEPLRSYALLAYQFGGFLTAGWMIVIRNRSSLSTYENQLVGRFALSLLLILPFLLTDFRFDGFDPPVRLGGVAILFLCWLVIGMRRNHLGHHDTMVSFAVLAAAAVAGGLGIAAIAGLDFAGSVQAIAITLSVCLLAAIFNDSMNLAAEERRNSLVKYLAQVPARDSAAFLGGLRDQIVADGALILDPDMLADYDTESLAHMFDVDPVRRISDVGRLAQRDEGAEQLATLFERCEATHLILVRRDPLTLVALNMPAVASAPTAETEMRAMQQVVSLILERADGTP